MKIAKTNELKSYEKMSTKDLILSSMTEGVIVLDEKSKIVIINDSAKSYLDLKNKSYSGKRIKDIVNFEPKLALNGGCDGFSNIRKVINKASILIKRKGKLILEIGFNQREKVKSLLENKGYYIDKVIKDESNLYILFFLDLNFYP